MFLFDFVEFDGLYFFLKCRITTEAMRTCGLRELHFRKAKK
jgi:hypothetical protein